MQTKSLVIEREGLLLGLTLPDDEVDTIREGQAADAIDFIREGVSNVDALREGVAVSTMASGWTAPGSS